jgi:hypothetical protein
MTFSGAPFSSEGIRKTIGPNDAAGANELSQRQRMAALDEADLRALERAEYYGESPADIDDARPATRPRRSILDRVLRR